MGKRITPSNEIFDLMPVEILNEAEQKNDSQQQ